MLDKMSVVAQVSWEEDNFDWLKLGPLAGQNGWVLAGPGRASADVIDGAGCKMLKIDTAPGATIVMDKDVPDQISGPHIFQVRVMVTGATEASLAKIEIKTDSNAGWDKKFQLYFGSSMRINNSPTSAVNFVDATTMGKWYNLRCEINLDAGLVDVYVDDKLTIQNLAIHPGPIVGLGISGWDRAGAVFLDDLHRIAQMPTVNLPNPNHAMLYGYYFVDGKYGDYRGDVNSYTNLYYASRWNYVVDPVPPDLWQMFNQSLRNAVAENRKIYLNMGGTQSLWDNVLDNAAPYWNNIHLIEIADEPKENLAQMETLIRDLRSRLDNKKLKHRPIGVVYTRDEALKTDVINASGLDWVGMQAYLDPEGSPDPEVNRANLRKFILQFKKRVPQSKQIVLVMMAYDRNGGWKNIATLRELQTEYYMQAYNEPRVIALTMFSYGRCGGTKAHPELQMLHRQIGGKILR